MVSSPPSASPSAAAPRGDARCVPARGFWRCLRAQPLGSSRVITLCASLKFSTQIWVVGPCLQLQLLRALKEGSESSSTLRPDCVAPSPCGSQFSVRQRSITASFSRLKDLFWFMLRQGLTSAGRKANGSDLLCDQRLSTCSGQRAAD